jgi:uncharacterized protein YqeY
MRNENKEMSIIEHHLMDLGINDAMPRVLRRLIAKTRAHRVYIFGKLYGWRCLWRYHEGMSTST